MIYNKNGEVFFYENKTFYVGEEIYATESAYRGLIGRITEIRTGEDRETENEGPDIHCEFEEPIMTRDKQYLHDMMFGIEDPALDLVIMAPEMIIPTREIGAGMPEITVYALIEDCVIDGQRHDSVRLYTDFTHAEIMLRNLLALHGNYKTMIAAIPIGNEQYIGVTSPAFCKYQKTFCKNPKETPYTREGRKIHLERTRKKMTLPRMEEILSSSTLGMLISFGKTRPIYNLEYFVNRMYALNRDKMLDVYLALHLFQAVKEGAQLILIGDSDQLPSVGPGAVLSEMISSGIVPTVRLDRVFRQNAGSKIATNAQIIRHGNLNLEYGTDFKLIESPELTDSAATLVDLYMQEAALHGIDNVALLTPLRQKTETCVNALNELIRDKVNPAAPSKVETPERAGKIYREGDKVMQIKNFEDVNNGDIGYIRKIVNISDETLVQIDFGDGRIKEYDLSEMDMIDLGYASTVHKSQGLEYSTVIINLQCAHYVMLTRPLVYTAITRGKSKVVIVGERRALCTAIKRTDTDKRGTCLAKRMQDIINSKE